MSSCSVDPTILAVVLFVWGVPHPYLLRADLSPVAASPVRVGEEEGGVTTLLDMGTVTWGRKDGLGFLSRVGADVVEDER